MISPRSAASASCSDWFCQMKSLCRTALPAVKGHFSLILAAGSPPFWGGRGLERGSGCCGAPQYGAPSIAAWCFGWCQRVNLISVKAAPVGPLLPFVGWGRQSCCYHRGGDAAGLRAVPAATSFAWPQARCPTLGTSYSCSHHCPVPTIRCRCTAGICSAVLAAGCKPATPGEARCTRGHRLAEPWGGGKERACEGTWGHGSTGGSV